MQIEEIDMPSYDIAFSGCQVFKLRGTACFSELSGLKDSVSWNYKGKKIEISSDYRHVNRDTVSTIVYHIEIHPSLLNKSEINEYVKYLYYHRGWGAWIKNTSWRSILKYGLIVDTSIHGEQILALLTAYRYLMEKSLQVQTFYALIHGKYKMDKDMAFVLLHLARLEGDNAYPIGHIYGHCIFNDYKHTLDDMANYVVSFPFEPVSDKAYNETLECRNVHNYFHQGLAGGTEIEELRRGLDNVKFEKIIKELEIKIRSIKNVKKGK